jgi:hypothetical protein
MVNADEKSLTMTAVICPGWWPGAVVLGLALVAKVIYQ